MSYIYGKDGKDMIIFTEQAMRDNFSASGCAFFPKIVVVHLQMCPQDKCKDENQTGNTVNWRQVSSAATKLKNRH